MGPMVGRSLVRRARWRMAIRAALLVTAVLAALSGAAYAVARDTVYEGLHDRLKDAAHQAQAVGATGVAPGTGSGRGFFQAPPPPDIGDRDGFFVTRDERYGVLAFLGTRTASGEVRWLATSAQDAVSALRVFLLTLGALTVIGGAISLPVGYLLAGAALQPLQQAVADRTEFVALASHRLRTPLSVVRTSAELALAGQGLSSEEALRIVAEQTQHMEGLAARLGLLARAEAAPAHVDARVDLQAAVVEVARALRPAADLARVTLEAHPGGAAIWVAGTQDGVVDALVSVLENAIRFTPAGGRAVVAAGAEGRYGVVTVTDTGPGIAPEDLSRITRPFVQGRGAHPGTGLGLAIARAVAVRHGGRLEITSPSAGGTTVRLLLPRRPAPESGTGRAEEGVAPHAQPAPHGAGPRNG